MDRIILWDFDGTLSYPNKSFFTALFPRTLVMKSQEKNSMILQKKQQKIQKLNI